MTAVRSHRSRDATAAGTSRQRSGSTARPLPQESAGPRLRIVGRRRGRDIGWQATVVLCIVGSFAALVASVAIQSQRIALQDDADRVAARTAEAHDRNRELRIEVIQAEAPEHVLEVARAEGLVEPGPIAVVPAVTVPPTAPDGGGPTTEPSSTEPSSTEPSSTDRSSTVPADVAGVASGPAGAEGATTGGQAG